MDPLFAGAALVLILVAAEIGYLAGLERGRQDPGTPQVISAMPLTFRAPAAPYQHTEKPHA